jgi:hypothetical protein
VGEGSADADLKLCLGEGLAPQIEISPADRDPSSGSLRLPPSPTRGEGKKVPQTGVKNGSGAPSVVLNTTLTFWPIFSFAMSQSTKLVSSDGPSFSVT